MSRSIFGRPERGKKLPAAFVEGPSGTPSHKILQKFRGMVVKFTGLQRE